MQNLFLGDALGHLGLDFHLRQLAGSDFLLEHLLKLVHALASVLSDVLEIILGAFIAVTTKGQRHRVALIDVAVQQNDTPTTATGIFHSQFDRLKRVLTEVHRQQHAALVTTRCLG